jgi:hypothetical protein
VIAELRRDAQILDSEIAAQEMRAHAFDRSSAVYPILARTLLARRHNLKATIAELERRLATVKSSGGEAVAA